MKQIVNTTISDVAILSLINANHGINFTNMKRKLDTSNPKTLRYQVNKLLNLGYLKKTNNLKDMTTKPYFITEKGVKFLQQNQC